MGTMMVRRGPSINQPVNDVSKTKVTPQKDGNKILEEKEEESTKKRLREINNWKGLRRFLESQNIKFIM
jgi:hypothetical protein